MASHYRERLIGCSIGFSHDLSIDIDATISDTTAARNLPSGGAALTPDWLDHASDPDPAYGDRPSPRAALEKFESSTAISATQ